MTKSLLLSLCSAFYGLKWTIRNKPMKSENQIIINVSSQSKLRSQYSVCCHFVTALVKEIFFRLFCCHFFQLLFFQCPPKWSLVKIFAGSLRILKDLQRPAKIFKDLQRSYKDPQWQGSLKDPQRFHEDLLKILWRSWQRSLQRSFQGSLRILKDLIRILKDLKRILSRIFKRSFSGSLRIMLGSLKDLLKIFIRIFERSL